MRHTYFGEQKKNNPLLKHTHTNQPQNQKKKNRHCYAFKQSAKQNNCFLLDRQHPSSAVQLFHIWGRKLSSVYLCSHADARTFYKSSPPIASALHLGLLKPISEEQDPTERFPARRVLSSHGRASFHPAPLPCRGSLPPGDVVLNSDNMQELQLTVLSLASFKTSSAWMQ